ncbi:epoxide hydrolase family protein [Mycobacterium sp. URHB0021]
MPGLVLPAATESVRPLVVRVPQPAIDDLERRLAATRWPDRETAGGWSQGVPLDRAKRLVDYWRDGYDWRRFESQINALPQFRTRIDGLGIHFIHVRSAHPNALPIILSHGWPGTFVEYLDTIDRLVDPPKYGGTPADAFDVVVPSLPGYGLSDPPAGPGWDAERTARAWTALMTRLGYTKWFAHGGDWGSAVTHALARQRPSGLLAAHVTMPRVIPPVLPAQLTRDERSFLGELGSFSADGFAYMAIQETRPQTIGYGLTDSPAAQATWIYEKFHAWSHNDGEPEDALSRDRMLDIISLFWFTNTATSAARWYWEMAHSDSDYPDVWGGRIELPMAATIFGGDTFRPPKSFAEQAWPNLFYWNETDRGGHFAALEQPALFGQEMWTAFRHQRT